MTCQRHQQDDQCTSNTESTTFGAQVTLEGGSVARAGGTIKGRVAIQRITNGSTTVEGASVFISSERDSHWARAHAASGGNLKAFSPDSCSFTTSSGQEISPSACHYGHVLGDEGICDHQWKSTMGDDKLSEENHSLDFEINVFEDMFRDFSAYYVTFKTFFVVHLHVAYPPEIRRCMFGEESVEEEPFDDADQYEESLWDEYTPVGQPRSAHRRLATHTLVAKIPITLVGAQHSDASLLSSPPPVHYLTPGVASPIILAGSPSTPTDIVFPISQPITTPEPLENTTSRMLSPPGGYMECRSDVPDPTRHYNSGPYAGLLWKKKILSELTRDVAPATEETSQRFWNI